MDHSDTRNSDLPASPDERVDYQPPALTEHPEWNLVTGGGPASV